MNYKFDEGKHIHLLNEQPLFGTSTVVKEVMPPFLAKWGAQCAVDFLKVNPEKWDDAVNAWTKVRKDAATKGTDMHSELEKYVKACIAEGGKPLGGVWPHNSVELFSAWSVEHIDTFIASEVHSFSEKLWVGGIIDCIAKMKDGTLAIVDFKSSKEAYFNHFAQVAGYALQAIESGYGSADGAEWHQLEGEIEHLIVVPFGAKTLKPEMVDNVKGFCKVFENLVGVYQFLLAFKKK